MEVQALLQLIGSGNVRTVEQEWMAALAEGQSAPQHWTERVAVLEALVEEGHARIAGELAWAALESLREGYEPADVLPLGGMMLTAVGECEEVRDLVADLYRGAYADRPNIDRLLDEVGLAGARTPRRALRTLGVCLSLTPGTYLVGRHDDSAARVERIDPQTWRVTVMTAQDTDELDPTQLADDYTLADPDDYRVLSCFSPDRLEALLEKDPVPVVTSIVRAHGGRMTGDSLEELLTSRFMPSDRWAKWWSRARARLKRAPDIRIEGRSPFVIVYDPNADTLEQEILTAFDRTHDSASSLKILQEYLRECRARKTAPAAGLLRQMADTLEARADRQQAIGNKLALETLLVAARARQASGDGDADLRPVELLAAAADPVDLIRAVEVPDLWIAALTCLEQARPEGLADQLAQLLRVAPVSVCDAIASRLVDLGVSAEELDELVQEIVAEPVAHFGALFWLWNGPSRPEVMRSVTPPDLLHRILSMLAELRRNDKIDRATVRAIKTQVRAALSARKCQRFRSCLDTMDPGTASAVNTQIKRLDELGRAVKEDLLKLITERFPDISARPKVEPWADENVLWVTAGGMAAKQAEIHEHVNVKMAANAKAIGVAAERGDLSENSEYKFALEERDLLRARLAQMNAEIGIARVLEPQDVPRDRVGIGSRVTLRRTGTGARRGLTILSAWEADAGKGIVNYKAPLARAVLGARCGETVELHLADAPGTYVVESLANALTEG
ncbi:MAG: GreA/GreB family elongation factor [Phycisphaerales bacterium]|nr:MAG: GreA/GreB family elongation factor [Phycisphaerales bacterium]